MIVLFYPLKLGLLFIDRLSKTSYFLPPTLVTSCAHKATAEPLTAGIEKHRLSFFRGRKSLHFGV